MPLVETTFSGGPEPVDLEPTSRTYFTDGASLLRLGDWCDYCSLWEFDDEAGAWLTPQELDTPFAS